jgi:APA family basic amino acid/polyamine antiporter
MHLKRWLTPFDATLVVIGDTGFAHGILCIRKPQLPRPYRAGGYLVVPLVLICFYIWFTVQVASINPMTSIRDLAMVISGLPFFLIWSTIGKF